MQLNESTYETIFLLYIDKELSPKERLEVEAFIADNSSYALEMEVLKATLLRPENIQFAFKENLKHQDWNPTYSTILKANIEEIPGLSTPFKNALKKEAAKEGIVLKPFGFSQQKFTYAAIAACLMVFLGYQQLIKEPAANSLAANAPISNSLATNSNKVLVPKVSTESTESTGQGETEVSNSNKRQLTSMIGRVTKTKQALLVLEKLNTSELEIAKTNQNATIAIAEPTLNNVILRTQTVISQLPSTYYNPMAINAVAETTSDDKTSTTYEVIDTEDPNRTIFIANFEIDGAAFRGITRRVSALLKRNKSEKEK
jgi:hypothetical protein